MDKTARKALSKSDRELLRATQGKALAKLDEDDLIELHKRVRRARNKYSKLYRRRSSAQVKKDRARGSAGKKHRRNATKAEIFEKALARVSRRLAVVARASADELRDERLAAARSGKPVPKGHKPRRQARPNSKAKRGNAKTRTPIRKRSAASARSAKRRHQAKRAGR